MFIKYSTLFQPVFQTLELYSLVKRRMKSLYKENNADFEKLKLRKYENLSATMEIQFVDFADSFGMS